MKNDEFFDINNETASLAAETHFDEAVSGADKAEWMSAIYSEFKSLLMNDTWEIVERPADSQPIGCRVVLRNKVGADESYNEGRLV